MPSRASKPAVLRETWRPEFVGDQREVRRRIAIRLTFTLILALFATAFAYLLFTPLFHPTTKLYFATAGPGQQFDIDPIPFFKEDALRFLASDGNFQPSDAEREFYLLSTPDAFRNALQRIQSSAADSADVTILLLCAHPLVIDGRPVLRCDNYDDANPAQGFVSMEETIDRLSGSSAGAIVILLDVGHTAYREPSFHEADDFLQLTQQILKEGTHENLVVISANSPGERSYRSSSLQSSIFAQAATRGLSGLADANSDRRISLEEFYAFLRGWTQTLVQQESGGVTRQTPWMLDTEASRADSAAQTILASAPASNWNLSTVESLGKSASLPPIPLPPTITAEETKVREEKEQADKNSIASTVSRKSLRVKEAALEELTDNINFLPTFLADRVKRTIGLSEDPATSVNPGATPITPNSTPEPDASNDATPTETNNVNSHGVKNEISENATGAVAANQPKSLSATPLPDLTRLGAPDQTNAQLIQLAWQFFYYLEHVDTVGRRPVDQAPHVWRAWLTYLHSVEQRQQTDGVLDPKTLQINLTAEIVGAYQLAKGEEATVGRWAKQVSLQMPRLEVSTSGLPSFGLAEQLALYGGPRLSSSLQQQIVSFDLALQSDSRDEFDRWLKQASVQKDQAVYEIVLAKQIGFLPAVPWSIVQKALQLLRRFERSTCDPMSSNSSLESELKLAQRWLLQGIRLASDQIGSGWADESLQCLANAQRIISATDQGLTMLHEAWHLRNQLLMDLPQILRWRELAVRRLGIHSLDDDVDYLLDELQTLSDLLQHREQASVAELHGNLARLRELDARIHRVWTHEAEAILNGTNKSVGSTGWRVDTLLSTSLLRDTTRGRLLAMTKETQANSDEVPMTAAPQSFSTTEASGNKASSVPVGEQALQAVFLRKMAGLAGWREASLRPSETELPVSEFNEPAPEAEAPENDPSFLLLAQFYRSLPNRIRGLLIDANDLSSPSSSSTQTSFSSPKSLPGPSSIPTRLQKLREAEQAMRLLEPDDAANFDGLPLASQLWSLEFAQVLGARQALIRTAVDDALPGELAFLKGMLLEFSKIATALSGQPTTQPPRSARLFSRGTTSLSLLADPAASGEVVWRNAGGDLSSVWILVDYDPELLEVEGAAGFPIYRSPTLPKLLDNGITMAEQQLILALSSDATESDRKAVAAAQQKLDLARDYRGYPLRPMTGSIPPSSSMNAGQELKIPFNVRRIGRGPDQAKIVWKLVSDAEYTRHEMLVQLPASEKLRVRVDGPSSSWTEDPEGVTLHPWPNRSTTFRIGLSNEGGVPRALSLELLALNQRTNVSLPEGFVTDETSREIQGRLGSSDLIASIPEIALDSSQTIYWLDLGGQAAASTDANADTAGPAAEKSDKLLSIPHGLVAVITDQSSKRKSWRRIDSRVRHPRSYVEPHVSYDAVSERITVRVQPIRSDVIPATGIAVRGQIEGLPKGSEMLLEGAIIDREGVQLYCQVPATAPRELTLSLDVDDFPRAFVFTVPCWRTMTDIPVLADSQQIKIVSPEAGIGVGAGGLVQPVVLKIDTVPGAFESRRDAIEIGWDIDRDREFINETPLRFHSDRAVEIELGKLEGDRLNVTARVKDLSVRLPPPPVKNGRVNLLARLSSAGEIVWSEPVEIIADNDPPTITGVELLPSISFAQGTDLSVRVGADDANLTGVETVEVAVDVKSNGQWDPMAKPVAAERQADGSWIAAMPTKSMSLGRVNLLIRATDRVGNVSQIAKSHIELFSAEQWEERQKSAVQEVTGTLTYSEAPLAGAKITLEDEKGKIAYTAATDARGIFKLATVVVGKYKIVAVGVAKNRPRKAESAFEVKGPPAPPVRLRMQAK